VASLIFTAICNWNTSVTIHQYLTDDFSDHIHEDYGINMGLLPLPPVRSADKTDADMADMWKKYWKPFGGISKIQFSCQTFANPIFLSILQFATGDIVGVNALINKMELLVAKLKEEKAMNPGFLLGIEYLLARMDSTVNSKNLPQFRDERDENLKTQVKKSDDAKAFIQFVKGSYMSQLMYEDIDALFVTNLLKVSFFKLTVSFLAIRFQF